MNNILEIENLSKQYRLGTVGTGTLSHDLNRWWYRMRGKEDPYLKIGEANDRSAKANSEYVWALRDINLTVKEGEVLGIIGKNGAGKSTLLKILSKVTGPTTGSIKAYGRIASLLEVGTGFHPELTGRENIFLNGAILGMTKQEIRSKFDEIVDFSGVERYIDTPVKRYSSGMYVRLAFAVAAHLEPEILIVDEVLAVGDAEFQKKAIGKMKDVSEGQGRTVLFVSHNMSSIRNICNKGLLISTGQIECFGDIDYVVNEYENVNKSNSGGEWWNKEEDNFLARLIRIEIKDTSRRTKDCFLSSEEINVMLHIVSKVDLNNVKIGFDLLFNGTVVFRTQQVDSISVSELKSQKEMTFICKIPAWLLNNGRYYVRPLFSIHCAESLTSIFEPVLSFNIEIDAKKSDYHKLLNADNHPGSTFPILNWTCNVE